MYNPYDLVKIKINGHDTYGRPVAFDSTPVDTHTLLNKEGLIISPVLLTSVCPDCGQGLEINVDRKLLSESVDIKCHLCQKEYIVSVPPTKPVKPNEQAVEPPDPLLCTSTNILDVNTTVSERMALKSTDSSGTAQPQDNSKKRSDKKPAKKPVKRSKKPKDSINETVVESFTEAKKAEIVDKAEGLTEEVDFDDTDMIEEE